MTNIFSIGKPRPNEKRKTIGGRLPSDGIGSYLIEIGRYPLLKADEEVILAQAIARGQRLLDELLETPSAQEFVDDCLKFEGVDSAASDWMLSLISAHPYCLDEIPNPLTLAEVKQMLAEVHHARQAMVNCNMRLVVNIAKKYSHSCSLDFMVLCQEGATGLMRAVDKFDVSKGYKFSTYSYWWIRQGITRAIQCQGRAIRLPVHIGEKATKIQRASEKLRRDGRYSIEALAAETNLTIDQVKKVLSNNHPVISLDRKVGKAEDTPLSELIASEQDSPEDMMAQTQMKEWANDLLRTLPPRERRVLRMRFGFNGEPMSLQAIGEELDVSRERVRQIERSALNSIRLKTSGRYDRSYEQFASNLVPLLS